MFDLWCLTPLSTIFQLYRGGQFIGGGNRSTWRKPPTCHKSLTNFINISNTSTVYLKNILKMKNEIKNYYSTNNNIVFLYLNGICNIVLYMYHILFSLKKV
jgi:hypothetical protein